jgi:acyl transferase domain-containing protein/3-hydroxymyristoyl/3-hydroxydecanoyl-(acyl carrier protein) dehydratase
MRNGERVAVVGVGGLMPGSGDLAGFWRNVRSGTDASTDVPAGRWAVPPAKAVDPRPAAPDRVPHSRGYYLPPFTADLSGLDLAGWPVGELDPVFHVALHIGNAAWKIAVTAPLDRSRCGVILGNIALPTEKTNAIAREVFGPKLGLFANEPPVNRLNRFSTGLPAALVARGLGFGLGGYALDAACSSSLYALKLACDELLAGRADAMVAGGLSRPDCLYTQMGFAQLRALSLTGRCSPFDAKADGLVVGEGGCAFVLKRLSDAVAHGDTILGVIAGIGLSNDVDGNLLLPASEGQLRAMRAAYKQAGWRPGDVQLIEGHATGTVTGDAVEFESYRRLWQGEEGRAVVGCVKSTVGHLLTGAGSAGLAKVLFAIRDRVLPPTANFERPSDKLGYDGRTLRILSHEEPWESKGPRRAAISAFGFGGINGHVLIEEFDGNTSPERKRRVDPPSLTLRAGTEGAEPIAVVGIASNAGAPLESLTVPLKKFHIPPKELAEMLPQQTLMLQVADAAIEDTTSRPADGLSTGVFVGISLDPNTTNFHLRWAAGEIDESLKDAVHPPLTANRTMGALGSIAASRVARYLNTGGPSFAVEDEEAGGLRALSLAVNALRTGEIDRALVGGVELATDPRYGGGIDGAAAVVLKRLTDAERDGDRVYGIVRDLEAVRSTTAEVSTSGAATWLLQFVAGCRGLDADATIINGRPAFWLNDRAAGPRAYFIEAGNAAGYGLRAELEEAPISIADRRSPARSLADRTDRLFLLSGDTPQELLAKLTHLRDADAPGRAGGVSPLITHRVPGSTHDQGANAPRSPASVDPARPGRRHGRLGLGFVAETADELRSLIEQAEAHLRNTPDQPLADRIYYSPNPLGGGVAFVYPGSGNHFPDMGRDLGLAFPHVLRRQMAENDTLRSQYHADLIWGAESLDDLTPLDLIFAQVALGTLTSDLLVSFGVKPTAALPYSLGESAMLYGTRAWRHRDEMFQRMQESSLFRTDLAGPCDAARQTWNLPEDEPVDWTTGVVSASADRVRTAIKPGMKAYVQILNTADDCVLGGHRPDVEDVVRTIGASFFEVTGVSTAHCEVARPVRDAYRALHYLPTVPAEGVRYYSGAWGRAYDVNADSAADAITAAVLDTIDFPRVVNAAYADGARIFVEVGPGSSCTRMIGSILAGKPHVARAVCVPRQDNVAGFLRVLASLHAEGMPVDLSVLYGDADDAGVADEGPTIALPVGYRPEGPSHLTPRPPSLGGKGEPALPAPGSAPSDSYSQSPPFPPREGGPGGLGGSGLPADFVSPFVVLAETQSATAQAHEAYLRFATAMQQAFAQSLAAGGPLAPRAGVAPGPDTYLWEPPTDADSRSESATRLEPVLVASGEVGVPRALDFEQCMEFARGKVGNVLGSLFAEVDSFPTRVRLPDGPLQLVDRILQIDGEPRSMTSGRVVTEHHVHKDRWYLEAGRIPTCVAVEAGQADLFLSGFLGIDFVTRGLACYRLLDAAVTFHRALPGIGDTIRYDIHIDRFFRQGDTHLFRFRFESTINGEPLMSMAEGVAGFFTAEELAGGKGIVHTELDRRPVPGVTPEGWRPHVPLRDERLSDRLVDALREGDLVTAFGPEFRRANLAKPARLPGGMMRLVHRVERIEPAGGKYGLGRIRGEADIHPDDWFLICHFVDDMVMPGTLMYECCLHTLRVLLMRMGWVYEEGEAVCEPVPTVTSKLKCRGQVIASTKKVTYEISLKEVGFRPEPYVLADALMYADGKPIVEITNMSLRMTGLTRERLDEIWGGVQRGKPRALFDTDRILAFAVGKPSVAFGDKYKVFDSERVIARLPGPPFQFLDRIVDIANCEPWKLAAGGEIVAEYDVPPDAWYFAADRGTRMPFSVLLEAALQPCGWLAAYLGSALTSDIDLAFRNLGGSATQFLEVRPDTGTLTTHVKIDRVSSSGGMLIQHFTFEVRSGDRPVYTGETTFGFFSRAALANQVGLTGVSMMAPGDIERAGWSGPVPTDPPFPDDRMRMIDTIKWSATDGGPRGLGSVEARAVVNPDAWFFKAHFYQDPVWPGSLGLESLIQAMKVWAARRWGTPANGWQATALNKPHTWAYRGQIIPSAKEVTVQAYITNVDDERQILTADGLLGVDGRIIYRMSDFTLSGSTAPSR